jgi:putative heme iron utilization protein
MSVADLERLLASRVASLAFLEPDGGPGASLVPFVAVGAPRRLVLLVSDLAAHARALRADPRVAVLFADPPGGGPGDDHATPRLSLRARAAFVDRAEAERRGFTAAYRAKYTIADTLLGLADFAFVELVPQRGTLVLGFGRAYEVTGPELEIATAPRGR